MDDKATQSSVPSAAATPPGPLSQGINRLADRLVLGIAHHWLALFTLAIGVYVGLPFAAPALMQAGFTLPAQAIYGIYSFTCHQLPDHSYFLFGDFVTPNLTILEAGGMQANLPMLVQRRFIGGSDFGYKVAICQRDVAIYGSVVVAGLFFGLVRRRLRPPSLKVYALLLAPIAVDGLSQMVGLRESNWWLRSLTGALFGVASVWLAYPYIQSAMDEVVTDQQRRQANQ